MKKRYINIKNGSFVETVDEFDYSNKEERAEANRCLNEYRLADPYNHYYLSQKCVKEWKIS